MSEKHPAALDTAFVHGDALEVLCRVFDDGADEAFEEWKAWYKPEEWLHPARGLGAFIRQRIDALPDPILAGIATISRVLREADVMQSCSVPT